jgi:hypothetical protein
MLLERIETYLRNHRMPPSRFGREVMGDPNFVGSLRFGRTPGPKTVTKVLAYLERPPAGGDAAQGRGSVGADREV